jgi:hypothetical protein
MCLLLLLTAAVMKRTGILNSLSWHLCVQQRRIRKLKENWHIPHKCHNVLVLFTDWIHLDCNSDFHESEGHVSSNIQNSAKATWHQSDTFTDYLQRSKWLPSTLRHCLSLLSLKTLANEKKYEIIAHVFFLGEASTLFSVINKIYIKFSV